MSVRKNLPSHTVLSRLYLLGLLALVVGGCKESDDETPKEPVCTPLETRNCAGPGACRGTQTCNEDGTELGACDCKKMDDASLDMDVNTSDGGLRGCKRFIPNLPSTCPLDIPCPCGGPAIQCSASEQTCPWATTCADAICSCPADHEPVSCSTGKPCWDGSCTGDGWGCSKVSSTDLRPGCTDSLAKISGVCECKDGRKLEIACGSLATCEEHCIGKASTMFREPPKVQGRGVPEGGACTVEGQVRCGTSLDCSEAEIVLRCEGGVYVRAGACGAGQTCTQVVGFSSARCEPSGINYASQGKPCSTTGGAACSWDQKNVLTCQSGSWQVNNACGAAQCGLAKAGEGTCPANASTGCITCK